VGRAPTDAPRLRNALELWATVLSRPEPDYAIVDFGRRDAPFDQGMPRPAGWRGSGAAEAPLAGAEVVRLSDQHAHVRLGAGAAPEVGDLLRCSVSHPCGAFDRWRAIPVVDARRAVTDAELTFF
jgi:D-serine deaminase-like pyridoxal phosphate-dependent protein